MSIQVGDCRDLLPTLPEAGSIRTCITSPPYFGLRDYGVFGQLGLETTPAEYVAAMVEVMRLVRTVLAPDGTLWLNLGDTYSQSGRGGVGPKQSTNVGSPAAGATSIGAPKNLLGIPWRVAFALQADGWYLRSDIIWAKPNPMPESVTDRPTKSHEHLFLLAKSERYYCDMEAIEEPSTATTGNRDSWKGSRFETGKTGEHQLGRASKNRSVREGIDTNGGGQGTGTMEYPAFTRNKRDVWTIPTQPFPGAHFAVMPEALVEPCVLAGSARGDTVLDPFAGAGTVGLVAMRHGREFVGIELNPAYAEMARQRLSEVEVAMLPGPDRWKERSRTLQGIADAMAEQWGATVPPVTT